MAKHKASAIILALVLAAAGVAGTRYYYDNVKPPEISPGQVIERYFEAVQRKDYATAYAFVSRRHYPDSFNQFKDRVDMYSPDMLLKITGETINDGAASVEARTFVPMLFGLYEADTRMSLVRVKREWKIIHP
jgi:hypothetical protein